MSTNTVTRCVELKGKVRGWKQFRTRELSKRPSTYPPRKHCVRAFMYIGVCIWTYDHCLRDCCFSKLYQTPLFLFATTFFYFFFLIQPCSRFLWSFLTLSLIFFLILHGRREHSIFFSFFFSSTCVELWSKSFIITVWKVWRFLEVLRLNAFFKIDIQFNNFRFSWYLM